VDFFKLSCEGFDKGSIKRKSCGYSSHQIQIDVFTIKKFA